MTRRQHRTARIAFSRRYAQIRHDHGLSAPEDALPLLARAAPALAALPPGTVKRASYADGHWTLDLALANPAAIGDLELRMRSAGVPALVAPSPTACGCASADHEGRRSATRASQSRSAGGWRRSRRANAGPSGRSCWRIAAAVLWAALWVPLARDTAALKLAPHGERRGARGSA
jgi:hypothetical protein